jgi:hypothetical protein
MWRGRFGLGIEEGVTMIVSLTIQQRMMSLVRWLLAKEETSSLDTAFWHDLIAMLSHCETPHEFAHCLQEEILSHLGNARSGSHVGSQLTHLDQQAPFFFC